MKKPVVSIIVPNYNHAPFLKKRLDSIFNQTYQDFEVILLDDASTDESVEFLTKYAVHPKVSHFIVNEYNSGKPFKQWKKGVDLAKGEFIWIAESDDYCDPKFLESTLKFIESKKINPGIIYCQSVDVDHFGEVKDNRINWTKDFDQNIWKNNFDLDGRDFIDKYLKVKNVIPNSSAVIFRKDLLDEHTFSKKLLNMRMCGDWLFWIKLLEKSRVAFVSDSMNYFREHSGVSRIHTSNEKKIKRLLEEKEVRKYLDEININQDKEVVRLYKSWIRLFPKTSLNLFRLYRILIKPSDCILLSKEYIKMKFKVG